jgi:hypothetical protein
MAVIVSVQRPRSTSRVEQYLRAVIDTDTTDLRSDIHDAIEHMLDHPTEHDITQRYTSLRDRRFDAQQR